MAEGYGQKKLGYKINFERENGVESFAHCGVEELGKTTLIRPTIGVKKSKTTRNRREPGRSEGDKKI